MNLSQYKALRRVLESLHKNEVACGISETSEGLVLIICKSGYRVTYSSNKSFAVRNPQGLVLLTSSDTEFTTRFLMK